ncbi:MAG: hypothetical protein CMA64_04465 [Euryarchaeota archaeon]|nr:hypothetical protein [Euryarchaeota archaeon]
MAGLTTSIVTSKNRAKPLWPRPSNELTPFYNNNSYNDGAMMAPPFANADNARQGFYLSMTNPSASIWYYDEDGGIPSDGVWPSGMSPSEASANADYWLAVFMDSTDNALYMATLDVGTTPDTLYFSKVDKAGSVTAIGSGVQLGNDSMSYSNNYWVSNYTGAMYRTGGDGSGNFVIPFAKTAGGNAAAGVPTRGVKIEINASNGSLSYSSLFGTNMAGYNAVAIMGAIGPTANNIYGGPFAGTTPSNTLGNPWNGVIANLSTGRRIDRAIFDPEFGMNATSTIKCVRWRSHYIFSAYSAKTGPQVYSETDMHNYIDEMAVYYGIL